MNLDEVKVTLKEYLNNFGAFCSQAKFDVEGIYIDHICYKCSSKEEYEALRAGFETSERFIYQAIISGRRISIIGFKEPLESVCGRIHYLELCDQRPDGSQVSGVDHIEPIPSSISYEQMYARFAALGLPIEENKKPHHATHDLALPNGIKLKLSRGKVVDTIYKSEMSFP